MSKRDDGGPAYPVPELDHVIFQPKTVGDARRLMSGMTLRDYFAAKAMQGFCVVDDYSFEKAAEYAYKQADAMIAERAK